MSFKNYADSETPSVGLEWETVSEAERISRLHGLLDESKFRGYFRITRAEPSGFVYVIFSSPIQVSKRGTLLLDLEDYFKINLEPGISLWCEPLGDKNSLRNLRGIQIKSVKD